MARRGVVLVAALLAGVALVPSAGAKEGVRATLTGAIPTHASQGTKIVVAFALRDRAGHPFDAEGVFVKLICPTRDASSIAFGRQLSSGHYRIVAIVPPGGLGSMRIGLRGSTDIYFPITNNPLAKSH